VAQTKRKEGSVRESSFLVYKGETAHLGRLQEKEGVRSFFMENVPESDLFFVSLPRN
jgi:hypothetical protein